LESARSPDTRRGVERKTGADDVGLAEMRSPSYFVFLDLSSNLAFPLQQLPLSNLDCEIRTKDLQATGRMMR
jgi:hypothetical protein